MGLGLHVVGEIRRRGIFGRSVGRSDLEAAFVRAVAGTPLAGVASLQHRSDDRTSFAFVLHPAEERVDVSIDRQRVVVNAKTSSAGPGYHRFLVEILDQVGQACGIAWSWSGDDEGDETGYAASRDYAALQREMEAMLRSLARLVLDRRDELGASGLALSMPLHVRPRGFEDRIMTQLGPLTLEDIEAALQSNEALTRFAAERYFPWWEPGFGPDFYRGLALQAVWCDVSWTVPQDDAERVDLRRIAAWCDQADGLPQGLGTSLYRLAAAKGAQTLPSKEGLGYRRSDWTYTGAGGWEFDAPGSLNMSTEKNGETLVLWNSEVTVRVSTVSAVSEHDQPHGRGPREIVVNDRSFKASTEDEGYELMIIAEVQPSLRRRELMAMTIWIATPELRDLAECIAGSLRHVPPAGEG